MSAHDYHRARASGTWRYALALIALALALVAEALGRSPLFPLAVALMLTVKSAAADVVAAIRAGGSDD